jgi:hypothetical protein
MSRLRSYSTLLVACVAASGCVIEGEGKGDPHHEHTLVQVQEEPSGANCELGGTAIHSGVDANGNNILEDAEISSSEYICASARTVKCIDGNNNVTGPVSLGDASDFTAVANVQCIDGDLMVVGSALASLPTLASLEIVTGSVIIAGNSSLTSLDGLPTIHQVGKKYVVQGNDALTDLGSLGALEQFQSVSIIGNDALTDLAGLEPFTDINGGIQVSNNSNLTSLHGLENLTRGTREGILIRSNKNLSSIEALANLRSAVLLEISGNANLSTLPLSSLEKVDVYLLVKENAALTTMSLPALLTTGGLLVQSNPMLTTLQAPELVLSGSVAIEGDLSLTSLSVPKLSYTTVNFDLVNLPKLTQADFGSLVAIGGPLQLYMLRDLVNLSGFSSLDSIGGNFTLRSCNSLSDFTGLANLVDVANMSVITNSALTGFNGLDSFTKVGGDLVISSNPQVAPSTAQAFSSAITVVGTVTIN